MSFFVELHSYAVKTRLSFARIIEELSSFKIIVALKPSINIELILRVIVSVQARNNHNNLMGWHELIFVIWTFYDKFEYLLPALRICAFTTRNLETLIGEC